MTNAWNAVAEEIKNGRCLLFSVKNNQEVWIESEAHLEPSQTSVMEIFLIKKITAEGHYFRKKMFKKNHRCLTWFLIRLW